MSPLNDRDLVLLIQKGHSIAPVIDHKSENAKSLGHSELVAIGGSIR